MNFSPFDPPRLDERVARNHGWLFVYASLAFVAAVLSPISRWIDPDCDWNLCLATVFWVALLGRMVGWSLDWPTGRIGRHAVAFFVGAICGSATIIWMQYVDHRGDFTRDFRDGIAAMSLFYGIGLGMVAEFVASAALAIYANAVQRS
ncbi:hypothetical protein K227x_17080 [Rubripirellula lacrimiformis]|uniref:Uncharacterized protein n=2 Tax=Rubripirellula lacrimiformis TaxID=1930273 RepID=A0A517N860_9BACT|nr:hypothetical protein K227x_17080 [Rubripirellula lacrimiformis]